MMHHPALEAHSDSLSTKEPARSVASTWTTSGSVGSKDCVLLFRLAALRNTGLPMSPESEHKDKGVLAPPEPPSKSSPTGGNNEVLDKNNRITTPTLNTVAQLSSKKLRKKRTHEYLSSSDNSISSTCDDALEHTDDVPNSTDGYKFGNSIVPVNSITLVVDTPKSDDDNTNEFTTYNVVNNVTKNATQQARKITMDSLPFEKEHILDTEEISPVNVAEMPGRTLKINYRFHNTETRLLRRILNSHGLIEVDETKTFNLLWTGNHVKTDVLRTLLPHQRVNHFPRSSELTRKDRLYKNIEKMQHLRGFKQFDIVPESFMLPMEYRNLVIAHRSSQKVPWIVKPAASSRGRGIFLVHSPEQIPMDEQVLVSRYIANPLCIDGHKCDVRLYVAVTSFDPLLIYMFDEGLVRLATVKYDKNVENLWNPCMHLCNYSINKYHSDYIKASDTCEDVGHKWSFSALLRHLKNQGCDTRELMMNIEDVIIKSIFACAQSIASACRMFVPSGNNCFELYGYDILIDDTLKPWLLEVNMSPSLGIDTPLDTKVKASMITDLMTLVGIPTYRPTTDTKWTRYRSVASITKCRKATSTMEVSSTCSAAASGNIGRRTGTTASNSSYLTLEELRIVRHARSQNERCGGFVRIFPTPDSLQKYGHLLDPVTGIPMSTVTVNGISTCSMILPHNFNQMLITQLYPGRVSKRQSDARLDDRMAQYERTLQMTDTSLLLSKRNTLVMHGTQTTIIDRTLADETKMLRRQIRRMIEGGSELSQLQARRLFQRYLETVLVRLATEPSKCNQHEKSILKFITRSEDSGIKTPSFIKNQNFPQQRVLSKDRSALVAKLLGDYLELYHRDSEAFVDDFDRPGIIPRRNFDDFIKYAQEQDLESVLTLHTNVTQSLPFLTTRCTYGIQAPPPIPTGQGGFLRALPSMVAGSMTSRDGLIIDSYYRSLSTPSRPDGPNTSPDVTSSSSIIIASSRKSADRGYKHDKKAISTSTTLPISSCKSSGTINQMKKRSVSQSALHSYGHE